ncbi:DUF1493 family protein [Salmonella enterica]|nr:hypothetical protein [Salmonella enterica]EDT1108119.1 DUF1493 family protein [Salmonella enterica subsp. enterica serovar Javiana]EFU7785118.1 DUF1493 family protein [Salmonella enterica]EHY9898688.1 DUF1493 family protein [Salmonella enterica]EJO9326237.1 DUF1493 family protein [Salmonella enterica]
MVSDALEQRIYELVRSHDGIYLFKKKELTPSTDLDSDLRLEDDEALALPGLVAGCMTDSRWGAAFRPLLF